MAAPVAPPCQSLGRRAAFGSMLIVVALGLVLRVAGVDWGGANLLHPDERFITMVATSLEPDGALPDYFDTATSTVNPENTGSHPQFVYGTAPVILVRLIADAVGATGLEGLRTVGRVMSTIWDLLTIWLVYLIGARLGGRSTGVLAAFLLAVTVLHIQHSHFFTVDLVQVFFVTLALYLAIRVADPPTEDDPEPGTVRERLAAAGLGVSLLFGLAAGAAVAAKLSAAPVVVLLPAAYAVRQLGLPGARRRDEVLPMLVALVASGLVFALAFRVLQPYAFAGPGFLDVGLNPRWVQAIESLRSLSGPDADWPPAMQWARRSPLFAIRNMTCWGFGLPLGLLAVAGLVAAVRRVVRRGAGPLALAAGWGLGYVVWQSFGPNPMMRYQLPAYPTLVALAAWLLTAPWREPPTDRALLRRRLTVAVGAVVALATAVYAVAFTGIYLRPVTREAASRWLFSEVPGPVDLVLDTTTGSARTPVPMPYDAVLTNDHPVATVTRAAADGTIRALALDRVEVIVAGEEPTAGARPPGLAAVLSVEERGESRAAGECIPTASERVFRCSLELVRSIPMVAGDLLRLRVELDDAAGRGFRIEGGAIANETSWDDGLPLRLDGLDPYGGIYQRDLNLELYWNDDEAKRERMLDILGRADVLVVSSSRQWASLTRIPERFPLVTAYYRHLVGCPPERSVEACFIAAEPGETEGDLGFELAASFTSPPRLGPLVIDDQWAEEAFTVYDHPKVLIFTKTAAWDPVRAREILETVDLDRVLVKPPGHFGRQPADLMLPADRFARQQAGGTWRERFPPDAVVNRRPAVAAVLWYLALAALGLGVAPLVRWALPGLSDGGLPLARGVGLLLLAWIVWIVGSIGSGVGPGTVRLTAIALIAAGAAVGWRRRGREDHGIALGRNLLTSELVFALFFVVCVAIRAFNPDLWHPSYGGEKPMDLAYFTAVLKSVSFPPYDPWFAGGYINYYYFGFVIVGQLALALGIQPSIAYNLALPTLIALAAAAAFSLAANAVRANGSIPDTVPRRRLPPTLAGIVAAVAVTSLGNLHAVRMFVTGLIDLGRAGGHGVAAALITGIGRLAAGEPLPIPRHHWFWNSTRIIPDPDVMPITEFPAFTFIYGDLHAHLMDLPQVLLAMAVALAVMVGVRASLGRRLAAVALGALAVGAMRPTNTWSYYPMLALVLVAVGWARAQLEDGLPWRTRLFRAWLWALGLAVLSVLLYLPFDAWFGMGYSEITYWSQSRTPLLIYLEHWAPFLLPIATWLLIEARDWLAATPLAAVRPLERHLWPMLAIALPALAGEVVLVALGVEVGWLAWPLLVVAGVLLLRRRLPGGKRFVVLAVGLGLALTLVVELVTLKFDLGRMNTVFKFYYVAWALLGVGAAVCLWWLAERRPARPTWRTRVWWLAAAALLLGAAVYPLRAVPARIAERIDADAPGGLDGLAYLERAVHHDQGRPLFLAEDLAAIRWLQRHVEGTPVIVEANIPEYRWGSRIAINTGLPDVVGWNWHQRQQRAYASDRWVWDRVDDVHEFYTTDDRATAVDFLRRYDVRFIVVGQLERAYTPSDGLVKFTAWEGDLWVERFREGETAIYEVIPGV